ncbi:DNA repair protein XRCC1-like isoform X2 [Ptychodera flava]|uniref:DNA repair protein XRCC1-like isoform X2 n=1 Tax=Ptychodera flava TaxID=63121 RepID=UPI00396A6CE1
MPVITIQHVLSCSTEDKNHKADNLLKDESYRKWKSSSASERNVSAILQFEKASIIHSIDIGNEGSAFVEVLVGKSTDVTDNYQVILVASSFMSPVESKNNTNTNRVRMFGPEKLSKTVCNQKWDRVKIVCTQPFNKTTTFGLSFIKFHSPPSSEESEKTSKTTGTAKLGAFTLRDESPSKIQPGSLFRELGKKTETIPLKGAAAVRAAATIATSACPSASQSIPQTIQSENKKKLSTGEDKSKISTNKRMHASDDSNVASSRKDNFKAVVKKPAMAQEIHVPSQKKRKSEPSQQSPFSELMDGVVFCISGYQNPQRSQLRDKAVDMGAKYRPDWTDDCTHLICAFTNTPKYNEVKKKGGRIVSNKWILQCYKKESLLPWQKLDKGSSSSDESDSDTDSEYQPLVKVSRQDKQSTSTKHKKPTQSKAPTEQISLKEKDTSHKGQEKKSKSHKKLLDVSPGSDTEDEIERIRQEEWSSKDVKKEADDDDDLYGGSTDEEPVESNTKSADSLEIPELPNFFSNSCFFFYGTFSEKERRLLTRYIIAYNGKIEEYMSDKVQFVVTYSEWDSNFNQALSENATLSFVTPKWIYDCYEKQKRQPYQPYAVIPQ